MLPILVRCRVLPRVSFLRLLLRERDRVRITLSFHVKVERAPKKQRVDSEPVVVETLSELEESEAQFLVVGFQVEGN